MKEHFINRVLQTSSRGKLLVASANFFFINFINIIVIMRTFVTLIFVLLLVLKAWCQTEERADQHMFENDLHQIRQLEGTNAEVSWQ